MMYFQLFEHWNTMTNEEIGREILMLFIFMIILVLITYISDNIKKKYESEILKSKNKSLKLSLNCKKDHCIYLAMISDEKFLFIFLFLKL